MCTFLRRRPCCCLYPFLSVRPSVRPSFRPSVLASLLRQLVDADGELVRQPPGRGGVPAAPLARAAPPDDVLLRAPRRPVREQAQGCWDCAGACRTGLDSTGPTSGLFFTVGVVSAAVFRNAPLRLFAWRRRKLAETEDRLFIQLTGRPTGGQEKRDR